MRPIPDIVDPARFGITGQSASSPSSARLNGESPRKRVAFISRNLGTKDQAKLRSVVEHTFQRLPDALLEGSIRDLRDLVVSSVSSQRWSLLAHYIRELDVEANRIRRSADAGSSEVLVIEKFLKRSHAILRFLDTSHFSSSPRKAVGRAQADFLIGYYLQRHAEETWPNYAVHCPKLVGKFFLGERGGACYSLMPVARSWRWASGHAVELGSWTLRGEGTWRVDNDMPGAIIVKLPGLRGTAPAPTGQVVPTEIPGATLHLDLRLCEDLDATGRPVGLVKLPEPPRNNGKPKSSTATTAFAAFVEQQREEDERQEFERSVYSIGFGGSAFDSIEFESSSHNRSASSGFGVTDASFRSFTSNGTIGTRRLRDVITGDIPEASLESSKRGPARLLPDCESRDAAIAAAESGMPQSRVFTDPFFMRGALATQRFLIEPSPSPRTPSPTHASRMSPRGVPWSNFHNAANVGEKRVEVFSQKGDRAVEAALGLRTRKFMPATHHFDPLQVSQEFSWSSTPR